MYDYLVAGAGLFGAVFAQQAHAHGRSVLVIDRRPHIGGNAYTEQIAGITVHRYGPHIFHTDDTEVWEYVRKFSDFTEYRHSPAASYQGGIYTLPFSMHTFRQMWGDVTPEEARRIIASQAEAYGITDMEPRDLEEQAVSLVGTDVYEKLIRGYTEKQWGRPCRELPASIIRRLPVSFDYNTDYFTSRYQGIPAGGYTQMISNMLDGIEVVTGEDYLCRRDEWRRMARKVVYTGPIDEYYGFRLGALEYRSVRFDTEVLEMPDFQGRAVVNYTGAEVPWTRITEHKWFSGGLGAGGRPLPRTVITREYSSEWEPGAEPYYPVGDHQNRQLYKCYRMLADTEPDVIFGGRLAEYRYLNMDEVIASALAAAHCQSWQYI